MAASFHAFNHWGKQLLLGSKYRLIPFWKPLALGGSIKQEGEAMKESGILLTLSWPGNRELLAMPHRGYGT